MIHRRSLVALAALTACACLQAATPDPVSLARDAVAQKALTAGLNADDVENLEVTDHYRSRHNGVRHVYLRQIVRGLPVVNDTANANIAPDGRVFGVHQRFAPETGNPAPARRTAVSAADAVMRFAADRDLGTWQAPRIIDTRAGGEALTFAGGSVSADDIPVELVYFRDGAELRLAWQMVVRSRLSADWWQAWVDAVSGEVIGAANWTAEADYRVFPLPYESPADGPDEVVTDPHDVTASPFGWHDTNGSPGAEFTDTRGNNVFAQEDTDANNSGGFRPDGGASLVFDFPIDLDTQQPADYQPFAIVNLFYWNNIVHDVLWYYGFDEPAGNFQENNYGNGGAGGDAVNADAQDGSDTNNANFSTPPDGSNPRMQMFIFTNPNAGLLTVNSPASVAGDYIAAPAGFGAPLEPAGTTADLALVDDGSAEPELGCNSLTGFPSGAIAVIYRGGCEFGTKALNAENAGAVAAWRGSFSLRHWVVGAIWREKA